MLSPRQIVQVSRPAFWSTHLWFYLLPLGGYHLLDQEGFWLGALYVTFPLGLLLYGWNDWADHETDRRNERKGNLLFGAKLAPDELARLPWVIAAVQVPFFALFLWLVGPKFLGWIAAALAVNAAYNWPRWGLKNWPVVDVASQGGYLLVFVLASWVNQVPQLTWPAMLFGLLFAMHSHLLGEIADIEPDRAAGRRTTAVLIGATRAKILIGGMLLTEGGIVLTLFDSVVLAAFLLAAGAGFLIDAVRRGDALVSNRQLAGLLISWNVVAGVTMYFVWQGGVFVGS